MRGNPGMHLSSGGRRTALYFGGLVLIIFAVASLAASLLQTPRRSGEIIVQGQPVRISFTTVPDPPKTGPIPIQVTVVDAAGSPAVMDQVVVRYGSAGDSGRERIAVPGASGGVYRAQIEFGAVGKAWIEIIVRRGPATGRLTFPVEVRPNI